jgi:hypothetical protein
MSNSSLKPSESKTGTDTIIPSDPESISFVRGLVANGQAARPNKDGLLPKGATHEIMGETEAGHPILRRRRFSAF